MNKKLPLCIENRELPVDNYKKMVNSSSYGYVNIMYLISLIITIGSVITIVVLGK